MGDSLSHLDDLLVSTHSDNYNNNDYHANTRKFGLSTELIM